MYMYARFRVQGSTPGLRRHWSELSEPHSVFVHLVQGAGFRVQGSGFRVQGSGFRVQGSGFRVQGSAQAGLSLVGQSDRSCLTLRP